MNFLINGSDIVDDSFRKGIFFDKLKLIDPFEKTNYQSVSLFSHISNIFERIIHNQINKYIKPFLSKILNGFRENCNTQHFLLKMLI